MCDAGRASGGVAYQLAVSQQSLQPADAGAAAARHSPFFLAFQDGLVRDKQLAEAIFAFTDAIPGATGHTHTPGVAAMHMLVLAAPS